MWEEVEVLIKYLWRCKACSNSGALGFTTQRDGERFHYCVYCDQGTQQEARDV